MTDGVVIKVFEPSAGLLPAEVEAFAIKAWLVGYRPRARRLHRLHDNVTYFKLYHPELTNLLRSNRLALAVAEDDTNAFVGFACGSAGVLHYVYVKHPFRLLGQGKALVHAACEGEPKVFTFEAPGENGRPRGKLMKVAARKGWRYHAHPVPGVVVRQQQRAHEETRP